VLGVRLLIGVRVATAYKHLLEVAVAVGLPPSFGTTTPREVEAIIPGVIIARRRPCVVGRSYLLVPIIHCCLVERRRNLGLGSILIKVIANFGRREAELPLPKFDSGRHPCRLGCTKGVRRLAP
jgi:hypothetical protein